MHGTGTEGCNSPWQVKNKPRRGELVPWKHRDKQRKEQRKKNKKEVRSENLGALWAVSDATDLGGLRPLRAIKIYFLTNLKVPRHA